MRKIFFCLFLLSCSIAFSQKDLTKKIEDLQKNIAKQNAELDSAKKVNDSLFALRMKRSDSAEMARFNEQNVRNVNSWVKNIQENQRKQKRAMWLRLGAGFLILAFGIFAMLRRRKKKNVE